MDTSNHDMGALFQQLGLPADDAAINSFIESKPPLKESQGLADAPYWSSSQASFLKEALADDSDWAEIVDELNSRLRS